MPAEAISTVRYKRRTSVGKARLASDALLFHGDFNLSIPFRAIEKVVVRDGTLIVTFADGTASFELGVFAAQWADKIEHPPTRLRTIGVKPHWRVSAIAIADDDFLAELEHAVAFLSIGRVAKPSDAIFVGVTKEEQLAHLARLKTALTPAGALWVVRPKGRAEISERAVLAAGKAAGLVDVKVVSLSPTHTAEKFVIPVKDRTL